MTSTYLIYRASLARSDDLRQQAAAWRRVSLARAELNQARSTTRPQPVQLRRHALLGYRSLRTP